MKHENKVQMFQREYLNEKHTAGDGEGEDDRSKVKERGIN
jgi:hypothetical protein